MNRFLVSFSAAALLMGAVGAQCFETNFGTSLGTGDDASFPSPTTANPMNITFPMVGGTFASYTHITVNTNGCAFLWNAATGVLGATSTGYTTTVATQLTNLRGVAGGAARIAPLWRDLNIAAVNGGAVWLNNTLPGKCVVTWANAVQFGQTSPVFTLQAQLFATGEVKFFYGSTAASSSNTIAGVSPGNAIAAVAGIDLCPGPNLATTSGLVFQQFTGGTLDLGGKGVSFLPNGAGYDQSCAACTPAFNQNYGVGCYAISDSFYQSFATAALASPALSGTAITLTPSGGGRIVTSAGSLLPVGSIQAVPTIVAVGDDVSQVVAFTTGSFPGSTGLSICSNGFVSLAAGNGSTFNPVVTTFLSDPQTSFRSWHDLNPTLGGSGQIKYEEDATAIVVTYDGVWDFGGTSVADANTIQFQFYPSGVVVIAWGSLPTLGASGIGYLVGYSPGGASINAGGVDLATALPLTVSGVNINPLALSASPTPVSTGTTGTTMTYTTSNIPEAGPSTGLYVSATILSIGQNLPGTDLGPSAPGCNQHITSLNLFLPVMFAGPTDVASFTLPAGVAPGFEFYAQSVALVIPGSLPNGQNPGGVTTSNGVRSVVNTF